MKNSWYRMAVCAALLGMAALCAMPVIAAEDVKSPAEKLPAPNKDSKTIGPNAPVAIVNGKPIVYKHYDFQLRSYMRGLSKSMGGQHKAELPNNDEVQKQLLEQMIEAEVLTQEIRKAPLDGVDELVKKEMDSSRKGFADDKSFQEQLAIQGLDVEMMEELIRRGVEFQQYVDLKVMPSIEIKAVLRVAIRWRISMRRE